MEVNRDKFLIANPLQSLGYVRVYTLFSMGIFNSCIESLSNNVKTKLWEANNVISEARKREIFLFSWYRAENDLYVTTLQRERCTRVIFPSIRFIRSRSDKNILPDPLLNLIKSSYLYGWILVNRVKLILFVE